MGWHPIYSTRLADPDIHTDWFHRVWFDQDFNSWRDINHHANGNVILDAGTPACDAEKTESVRRPPRHCDAEKTESAIGLLQRVPANGFFQRFQQRYDRAFAGVTSFPRSASTCSSTSLTKLRWGIAGVTSFSKSEHAPRANKGGGQSGYVDIDSIIAERSHEYGDASISDCPKKPKHLYKTTKPI